MGEKKGVNLEFVNKDKSRDVKEGRRVVHVNMMKLNYRKENMVLNRMKEETRRKYELKYWEGRGVLYVRLQGVLSKFILAIEKLKEARVKDVIRMAGYTHHWETKSRDKASLLGKKLKDKMQWSSRCKETRKVAGYIRERS